MSVELKDANDKEKLLKSMHSEQTCFHIEADFKDEYDENGVWKSGSATTGDEASYIFDETDSTQKYIVAKLNRNLVALRGSISFAPQRFFDEFQGTTFFEVDDEYFRVIVSWASMARINGFTHGVEEIPPECAVVEAADDIDHADAIVKTATGDVVASSLATRNRRRISRPQCSGRPRSSQVPPTPSRYRQRRQDQAAGCG